MGFIERVQQAVLLFRERVHDGPVLVVGNLDTDGITSTSLLVKGLMREGLTFSVKIIKQITDELLVDINDSSYTAVLFADLGSGMLGKIEEMLEGKQVFVFDHHYPDKIDVADWIVHVNPHLDGIDGTKEVSAAGVCYFFVRALDKKNVDLAYLALIGAVGDMQENMGFKGLNKEIVKDAVASGGLEVKEGLRIFGAYTKPLCKVLEYSTNPYIPGVTGDRMAALRFLEDHGIVSKGKGNMVRLIDLSEEGVKKLYGALREQLRDAFKGPVYFISGGDEGTPFYEIKEFSTLLNACGRSGKPSVGVGVCLGDEESKKKALEVLQAYRKSILDALQWFYHQRNSKKIIEKKGFVIIYGDHDVSDALIGTLTSLVSKSHVYPDGTILIGIAATLEEDLKLSGRISGFQEHDIDLRKVMKELVKRCGGYGGGHRMAAGATVPGEKSKIVIDELISILEPLVMEEKVAVSSS